MPCGQATPATTDGAPTPVSQYKCGHWAVLAVVLGVGVILGFSLRGSKS